MPTNWIEKAQRLGDGSIGGAMDHPSIPGRVVWHTTESDNGDDAFRAVAAHLIRVSAEPHLLYDPTTDRLGQFGPLNASSRALLNDGSTRTNRVGGGLHPGRGARAGGQAVHRRVGAGAEIQGHDGRHPLPEDPGHLPGRPPRDLGHRRDRPPPLDLDQQGRPLRPRTSRATPRDPETSTCRLSSRRPP